MWIRTVCSLEGYKQGREGGAGPNWKKGNIEGGLRIVRNDGNKRR